MRRITCAALLTAMTAIGCASDPSAPRGVFFPTVPVSDSYPTALMRGTLLLDDGCLFVTSGSERWLLLWPEGYTARRDGEAIEIFTEDRGPIARVGQPIRIGGGERRPREMGGAAAAERSVTELTGEDIPERCGDLYWIVSPI
jgi:hypothetical protein